MEIGKKIKKRRNELGITQEALGRKINVARSTISNWEIGRNYPDIQTIILLSDELDISLDELLKEDKSVVKKITEDTNVRKKNKNTIIILSVLVALISLLAIWLSVGQPGRTETISEHNEIRSASLENDSEGYTLDVKVTDLPVYRTLSLYSLGESEGGKEITLMLRTDLDFLFENSEEIKIQWDNSFAKKAETLNIVDDKDQPIYTIEIP